MTDRINGFIIKTIEEIQEEVDKLNTKEEIQEYLESLKKEIEEV